MTGVLIHACRRLFKPARSHKITSLTYQAGTYYHFRQVLSLAMHINIHTCVPLYIGSHCAVAANAATARSKQHATSQPQSPIGADKAARSLKKCHITWILVKGSLATNTELHSRHV